jgi:hypothetical protein
VYEFINGKEYVVTEPDALGGGKYKSEYTASDGKLVLHKSHCNGAYLLYQISSSVPFDPETWYTKQEAKNVKPGIEYSVDGTFESAKRDYSINGNTLTVGTAEYIKTP